jgi:hypothetical protein
VSLLEPTRADYRSPGTAEALRDAAAALTEIQQQIGTIAARLAELADEARNDEPGRA